MRLYMTLHKRTKLIKCCTANSTLRNREAQNECLSSDPPFPLPRMKEHVLFQSDSSSQRFYGVEEKLQLFVGLRFAPWIDSAVFYYQLSLWFQMGWWRISHKWNFLSAEFAACFVTRLVSIPASPVRVAGLEPLLLWRGAFLTFFQWHHSLSDCIKHEGALGPSSKAFRYMKVKLKTRLGYLPPLLMRQRDFKAKFCWLLLMRTRRDYYGLHLIESIVFERGKIPFICWNSI